MVHRICLALTAMCAAGTLLCAAGAAMSAIGIGHVAGMAIPHGRALCSMAWALAGASWASVAVQLFFAAASRNGRR